MPRLSELAERLNQEDTTRVFEYHRNLAHQVELDYARELYKAMDEKRASKIIYAIERRGKIYLLVRVIFDLLINQPELIDREEMSEEILMVARKLSCFDNLSVDHHIFMEALKILKQWREGLALNTSFLNQLSSLRETRSDISIL